MRLCTSIKRLIFLDSRDEVKYHRHFTDGGTESLNEFLKEAHRGHGWKSSDVGPESDLCQTIYFLLLVIAAYLFKPFSMPWRHSANQAEFKKPAHSPKEAFQERHIDQRGKEAEIQEGGGIDTTVKRQGGREKREPFSTWSENPGTSHFRCNSCNCVHARRFCFTREAPARKEG